MDKTRAMLVAKSGLLSMVLLSLLAACAGFGIGSLTPGQSTLEDVLAAMGPPAMEWRQPDGSRRLAYPRGPTGVHTHMVDIAPDGRLSRIDNAMAMPTFTKVVAGMDTDEVLRLLGPPVEAWTSYYAARDELARGWRYCDDWNQLARFFVLFDGTKRTVRSTMSLLEGQFGDCGDSFGSCWCSR